MHNFIVLLKNIIFFFTNFIFQNKTKNFEFNHHTKNNVLTNGGSMNESKTTNNNKK